MCRSLVFLEEVDQSQYILILHSNVDNGTNFRSLNGDKMKIHFKVCQTGYQI